MAVVLLILGSMLLAAFLIFAFSLVSIRDWRIIVYKPMSRDLDWRVVNSWLALSFLIAVFIGTIWILVLSIG